MITVKPLHMSVWAQRVEWSYSPFAVAIPGTHYMANKNKAGITMINKLYLLGSQASETI